MLLCLAVDGLLRDLAQERFAAEGYTDDVAIITFGKFDVIVIERLRSSLKRLRGERRLI